VVTGSSEIHVFHLHVAVLCFLINSRINRCVVVLLAAVYLQFVKQKWFTVLNTNRTVEVEQCFQFSRRRPEMFVKLTIKALVEKLFWFEITNLSKVVI
jgi:hypothetical protein